MSSSQMKSILHQYGLESTDDPVVDYLLYFWEYIKAKDSSEEFRKKHDLDCVHTDGNLYADTIFSFWFPFKMYLQAHYPEYYSGGVKGTPRKNITDIDELLGRMPLIKMGKDYHLLSEFASLAQTRENVMILPDRKMQKRGVYWLDQMPITLKACFSGSFSLYFKDRTVLNWIAEEHLDAFFDGEPSEESIRKLGTVTSDRPEWCSTEDDVCEMLKAYIDILKKRQL